MNNHKGQTVTEMVFVLPLLIMLAGGMLFVVYAGWQDLKLQQAANLVARVEGQEKVIGGVSDSEIDRENGFLSRSDQQFANPNIGKEDFGISEETQANSGGAFALFDRMKNLVAGFLGIKGRSNVTLLPPRISQNVDQITITKILPMFKIPFMKGNAGLPDQIILQSTAYGGEDPHMYALPRWGIDSTSKGVPEWRNFLKSAVQNNDGG